MPIDTHVRIAAWLHIVMGGIVVALFVLVALIFGTAGALAVGHGMPPLIAGLVGSFGFIIFGFFFAFGAIEVIGGVLLLRGSAAGRVITILYSVLSLLNFPIGTAAGGYSLWALLRTVPQPMLAGTTVQMTTPQSY